MLRRLLIPALAGGAVIGVLSALPLFAWGNTCCCLWILLGGAVAAYQLQQQQAAPLTPGDGALVGAYAGVLGALIYLLVDIPVTLITTPLMEALKQRLIDAGVELPPALAGSSGAAATGLLIATGFVMMLFIGPIFATVGGLIGTMAFRKPASPATPPDGSLPPDPDHIP